MEGIMVKQKKLRKMAKKAEKKAAKKAKKIKTKVDRSDIKLIWKASHRRRRSPTHRWGGLAKFVRDFFRVPAGITSDHTCFAVWSVGGYEWNTHRHAAFGANASYRIRGCAWPEPPPGSVWAGLHVTIILVD